jgi:uncharacterized protein YndB with AHSA1/START domain
MPRPQALVYTIYIRAGRDQVWDALTQPEATSRYFHGIGRSTGSRPHSSWRPGERLLWTESGSDQVIVDGQVIEYRRPTLLAYSWSVRFDDELAREASSRVTWTLEEPELLDRYGPHTAGITQLTMVHDNFPTGSKVYGNVARGWPFLLSSLKTFLETRTPLAPDTDAVPIARRTG